MIIIITILKENSEQDVSNWFAGWVYTIINLLNSDFEMAYILFI